MTESTSRAFAKNLDLEKSKELDRIDGIDLNEGLLHTYNNADSLREALISFAHTHKNDHKKLTLWYQDKKMSAIQAFAGSLKNSCVAIGATETAHLAACLEIACAANISEDIKASLLDLRLNIKNLLLALDHIEAIPHKSQPKKSKYAEKINCKLVALQNALTNDLALAERILEEINSVTPKNKRKILDQINAMFELFDIDAIFPLIEEWQKQLQL